MKNKLTFCVYVNAVILLFLVLYFVCIPACIILHDLNDLGLNSGAMPRFAFRWHHALSKKYAVWARERIASERPEQLSLENISGTEWPVFSAVFYLWATEALQEAWEHDPTCASVMPKVYAREAIEAAVDLAADPNNANWVKRYWGERYLERENLFYRSLLISALTSYQTVSGNDRYRPLLAEQAASLAQEIDQSPYGLLDDYPAACYPVDMVPAIAAIRRADRVLGTDRSAFVKRALRAFGKDSLDPHTGLPAYAVDSTTGKGYGSARGVEMSFILMWAPDLWPETAMDWYSLYEEQFWQRKWLAAGFRELPKGYPRSEWLVDADSGPVAAGYGTAANAFGIGAARVNGRFDHARPLMAQALAVTVPLLDGTLLGPRTLSNLSDAPYLGEAALLFSVTRPSTVDSPVSDAAFLPVSVYLILMGYMSFALLGIILSLRLPGRWKKGLPSAWIYFPKLQFVLWICLLLTGLFVMAVYNFRIGFMVLLAAQFLPRCKRKATKAQLPETEVLGAQ